MHFFIDIAIRSTLLIVFCFFVLLLIRKGRSMHKHWLVSITMLGLLFLPIINYFVPHLKFDVGTYPKDHTLVQLELPIDIVPADFPPILSSPDSFLDTEAQTGPISSFDKTTETIAPIPPTSTQINDSNGESQAVIPFVQMFMGIWLCGILFLILRFLNGLYEVISIGRRSVPSQDLILNQLRTSLKEQLKLSREVDIRISEQANGPMTWGLFKPVILLPHASLDWSEKEKRIVLLHEFAHIKRNDYMWNIVGILSTAIYWFHPLIWRLKKIQFQTREKACDELVLTQGIAATDYAQKLLDLSKKLSARSPSSNVLPALRMAQYALIKSRIQSILTFQQHKNQFKRAHKWVMGLLCLGFLFTSATLKPSVEIEHIPSIIPGLTKKIPLKFNPKPTLADEKLVPIFSDTESLDHVDSNSNETGLEVNSHQPQTNSDIQEAILPIQLPNDLSHEALREIVIPLIKVPGNIDAGIQQLVPSKSIGDSLAPMRRFREKNMEKARKKGFKGSFGKTLKKRFTYISAGEVWVDSNMTQTGGFYMQLEEVSNADYRFFLEELNETYLVPNPKDAMIDVDAWNLLGIYADPVKANYHRHPAFYPYPVVNITHKGAKMYCDWLTQEFERVYGEDFPEGAYFRLPTKKEWVRAARGHQKWYYPWQKYTLQNEKGQYLANFQSMRSAETITFNTETQRYEVVQNWQAYPAAEGYMIQAPTDAFPPLDNGLYNMIGNVAEMLDQPGMAIGGSWRSPGFDVRVESIMTYEGPSPEVGFRPVLILPE